MGTCTITGQLQHPDKTPREREQLTFTPNTVIKDTAGNTLLSGRVLVTTDDRGSFTVPLVSPGPGVVPGSGQIGYTVAPVVRGVFEPFTFVPDDGDSEVVFTDLAPAVPSPIATVDATQLRADINALSEDVVHDDQVGTTVAALDPTTGDVLDASGQPVVGATDAAVAGFVTGGGETQAALAGAYVGKSSATTALPAFQVIAHRGGTFSAPEETAQAYRVAADAGADILEADVQALGDGALVLIHDATVDRTSDNTGQVGSYLTTTFKTLDVAHYMTARGTWPGGACQPITLREFISEFGGNTTLQIQPIADIDVVLDLCDRMGMRSSIIIEAEDVADCAAAAARGYESQWVGFDETDTANAQAALDAGATRLRVTARTSDAVMTNLVALGAPLIVGGVNRRWVRDHIRSLGAAGVSSDTPVYLAHDSAMLTQDPWRRGSLGHGALPFNDQSSGQDLLSITDSTLYLGGTAGNESVLQGDLCPIANAGGTYTIGVSLGFDALPASPSGRVGVGFGADSDRAWRNVAGSYVTGWFAYINKGGTLALYRNDDADTSTYVTSKSTPALAAGTLVPLSIAVTPTTITVTRTDTGDSITTTDSAYRGGYFHLTKDDAVDGESLLAKDLSTATP